MMTFYYRFWAQIQGLEVLQRVLIVMGIATFMVFLVLRITYRIWRGGFLWLVMKIRNMWYILISDYWFDIRVSRSHGEHAQNIREKQNVFLHEQSGKIRKKQRLLSQIMEKKKKFSIGWWVLLYLFLTASVLLPRYTPVSVPVIEKISREYTMMEKKALSAAEKYEPFWKQTSIPTETVHVETTEEAADVVSLHLSAKGWDGSNIRAKADQNSAKITTVQGDISMKLIDQSENEKWILIELTDGTRGWIHNSLVEVDE